MDDQCQSIWKFPFFVGNNYFETLPKNQLEVALWLEADRMGFLLDAVTQKKFEVQRSTVKNEKGEGDNRPYGKVGEIMEQSLYPAGHPYSWPTIGFVEDLNRVNVEDLKNFFLRWYGPNNAILTVSGDITAQDVLKLTEKYFGTINKGPEVRKQRVELPTLPVDRYANYGDDIFFPLTEMVYPGVPNYHADEPALDMLAALMGQGNNTLLYKNFVKAEKAIQVSVSNPCYELAGEFTIDVLAYPDQTFQETEALIRKTIDEFEKAGVSDEALSRVKSVMTSNITQSMESIAGKSAMLTQWQMLLAKPYNLNDEIARYNKVSKEDVVRVFNKYVKGKTAAIISVFPKPAEEGEPKKEEETATASATPTVVSTPASELEYKGLSYVKPVDNFDRAKKPAPGSPVTPVVPKFFNTKFENGIKIIGNSSNEMPTVNLLLSIEGTNLLQSNYPGKLGIAGLTADMMNEGTQNYTTEQISAELDKLGANISFNADADATTVFVSTPKKNLDATLKLLEEKLLRPKMDPTDFRRVKKAYVESVNNQRTSPDLIAEKVFAKILYGNTALGQYYTGTAKTIGNISIADVKEFYDKYYSPSITNLVIVGDVTEQEILPKLSFLKSWTAKSVQIPVVNKAEFPQIGKTQIYLVHRPYATQSSIRIGTHALPYDATGEYFKASVMNFDLGGNFNSRMNLNIREDKGFSYGVRSGFRGGKTAGAWAAGGNVRASATDSAINEFVKEIELYRNVGITDDGVNYTKSSLTQADALRYETSFQKAFFLNRIVAFNLPADFVAQQTNILNSMTKQEINDLAKKYIPSKDNVVILVVGDKYKVKKRLEALGYGKVIELDKEGK